MSILGKSANVGFAWDPMFSTRKKPAFAILIGGDCTIIDRELLERLVEEGQQLLELHP